MRTPKTRTRLILNNRTGTLYVCDGEGGKKIAVCDIGRCFWMADVGGSGHGVEIAKNFGRHRAVLYARRLVRAGLTVGVGAIHYTRENDSSL